MSGQFPQLDTGALAQYPIKRETVFSSVIYNFLDGSVQKFRRTAKPMRRWSLQLRLLTENELHQIRRFAEKQYGAYSAFTFIDPTTGEICSNCRIESDIHASSYDDITRHSTDIVIVNQG